MVRPASALRHHVVDGEVAEGEHHPTAVAQALLLAEEHVLVLAVRDRRVNVRPPGDVVAVCDVAVMKQAADRLLETHVDELDGLWR